MCYNLHNSCLYYHNTQFFLHRDIFCPFRMITPLPSCVLFCVTHSFTFMITHSHPDVSYLHINHPIVITRCCYLLSHSCYIWHKEASKNIIYNITTLIRLSHVMLSSVFVIILYAIKWPSRIMYYVHITLRISCCVTFILTWCYQLCSFASSGITSCYPLTHKCYLLISSPPMMLFVMLIAIS